MNMVHATIERNEMRVAEKDRRDATQLEWQQVAMVLDRFLLIVFLFGTALSSFVILYQKELGIFE
uniref:Neur_chan_memb domain-containing protein n=1 Tax=Heterorhabditis bacteriophora TaxID=37862 RepID=A0A1I7X2I5_HETBA